MNDPVLDNVEETQKQIFIDFALNSLCKLLGDGEVHHQTIINSEGYRAKRIIITYDEENKGKSF